MIDKKYEPLFDIAREAGAVLLKYLNSSYDIKMKQGVGDPQTTADLESEALIIKRLEEKYPDYNIYGEESGEIAKNSEYTILIDPLDGTHNFTLGVPHIAVVLAILHNSVPIVSVIYDPVRNVMYCAQRGKGAYCDGEKLKVSGESDITKSVVAYYTWYTKDKSINGTYEKELLQLGVVRLLLSWTVLDFCKLAEGKIHGIVGNGMERHDYFAGALIAQEAGAMVTDFTGEPDENLSELHTLTANTKEIHQKLLDVVSHIA